ncbi:hypothetical protein CEXT_614761 [Caerostris extrusa]|uniref:Uncharacterized protein n=1 Tax=Caerostris extrusa TaxID=172846 RepID=A0AAV4YA12_CAEEX|nr:hypothetical protein CEXT_614761 [Caerostris extrusa]
MSVVYSPGKPFLWLYYVGFSSFGMTCLSNKGLEIIRGCPGMEEDVYVLSGHRDSYVLHEKLWLLKNILERQDPGYTYLR